MQLKIFLFVLFFGIQSYACPRTYENLICPGDVVISEKGFTGKVKAVNPFKKTAAVQWTRNPSGYSVNETNEWPIYRLAISVGCIEGFCVGDTVISKKEYTGKVIGVNPHLGKVAVHWNLNPNGYSTNETNTWDINDLALGYGCALGYCVGDTVVNTKGYTGKIIGINHKTFEAAVRWTKNPDNYSVNEVATWDITMLANAEYCNDYGAYDRSLESSLQYGRRLLSRSLTIGFQLKFYIK